MDQLDVGHVLEVPDTPNRQSSQNKDNVGLNKERSMSVETHPEQGSVIRPRKIIIRPPRRIGGSLHSAGLDCHVKSSAIGVHDPPTRKDVFHGWKDSSAVNHKGKHSFSAHHGKRENLMLDREFSSCKGSLALNSTEQSRHADGLPGSSLKEGLNKRVVTSCEVPYFLKMGNPSATTNKVDKGKHIDDRDKVGVHSHGEWKESGCDVQPSVVKDGFASVSAFHRDARKKRLVRNGCISPHNIAKGKQAVGKDHSDPIIVEQNYNSPLALSGSSKNPIDVKDMVSEDRTSRSIKGKDVLIHPSMLSESNANPSCRNIVVVDDEVNETTGPNQDTHRSFEEPGVWRTTRSRNQNRLLRRENESDSQNLEHYPSCGDSSSSSHTFAKTSSQMAMPLGQQSGQLDGHHSVVSSVGKRQKRGSATSNQSECSTSALNESDIMFIGSSRGVRNNRSDRNQNGQRRDTLASTIEFNGSFPQARNHSSQVLSRENDEDVRARQLEADEMLARELQEQLYNDIPVFGVSEIDEDLARALQQDDLRHALTGEADTVLTRGRSVARSQRQSQSQSSTNGLRRASLARASNSSRLSRLRSRFSGQPRTLSAPRRRNSIFPPNVNVETRIRVLETLEAFSNMGVAANFLQTRQDFNENDYEMLLALDENNHQHAGASMNRINGLPESIVQTANLEEACAICLETPTMGDSIRHLPCLHKFHKDCIDPWLQRRSSCPVCKSSITG